MVQRLYLERVRQNLCAAVRGGAQAHNLRAQRDRAVVGVMRDVAKGNVNRQSGLALFKNTEGWRQSGAMLLIFALPNLLSLSAPPLGGGKLTCIVQQHWGQGRGCRLICSLKR